jgi:Kef-type K+ transport system membrane component KefB
MGYLPAPWFHARLSEPVPPIFFAYTGLRTDIGAIQGWWGLVTRLLVFAVAFSSKFGGAYVAARLVGEGQRSALTIGVSMTRGG